MPEQQQATPPAREAAPKNDWEIGKAMNGLFGAPVATDRHAEEQELDTDGAPDEGTAPGDESDEQERSGNEEADPEDEGTSKAEPFMVLKVDGKDIVIGSKEEAVPLAQKGMHYTQAMQQLRATEQQRASEHEQVTTGLRQRETQYAAALQTLNETYGFVLGKEQPDWASDEMQKLKRDKPEEFLAIREQWDQLGAIRSDLARIARERQEQEQKRLQGWIEKEQSALAEKRPEWADQARRQQDWSLIRDYAVSQGITEPEIGNLFDHRFWMILHDAARYRQAEAAGKTKREAAKLKTAEPGTGKNVNQGNRQFRAERERLRTTGDVRAAGNILQDLMTRPRK